MQIRAILRLHITMVHIEEYMVQVGVGDLIFWVEEDLGFNARGQVTIGVQPENYYRMMPPLLVLSLDP